MRVHAKASVSRTDIYAIYRELYLIVVSKVVDPLVVSKPVAVKIIANPADVCPEYIPLTAKKYQEWIGTATFTSDHHKPAGWE
jgi:hypothetical protein